MCQRAFLDPRTQIRVDALIRAWLGTLLGHYSTSSRSAGSRTVAAGRLPGGPTPHWPCRTVTTYHIRGSLPRAAPPGYPLCSRVEVELKCFRGGPTVAHRARTYERDRGWPETRHFRYRSGR